MNSFIGWLNEHVKELDHEVFRDVVKISGNAKPMADGQVVIISEICRMTLTLEKSNGDKKILKVVTKLEPPPGAGNDLAKDFCVFDHECLMYSDLLKKMEKLLKETNERIPWTECYLSKDKKLIFNDLCEDGYKIVPTHKFLDLDHAKLAMEAIGKYHGASNVMNQKGMFDGIKSRKTLYGAEHPFLMNVYMMGLEGMIYVMKSRWGPEWTDTSERMLKFKDRTKENFHKELAVAKSKWNVLLHGDFTIRNMLFHYPAGSTKPDDVKFIDFQMVNYNNLGLDLSTLLYSSMLPKIRDDNMDMLLNAYCKSFATTCQQLGYKGPIPTVEDVTSCLKSLNLLTTNTSFSVIPFFIASEAGGMQEKSNEGLELITNKDNPTQQSNDQTNDMYIEFLDNAKVAPVLQYEIRRCMRENII